ncbi:PH domain-containing protein [Hamadaea sp. NPDC051192]|uniref:PH domain-containing protein n=1 Tax=Hamadaea sp. NPDC051192 TaxID=3154940 RepID=UPI003434A7BD
MTSWRRVDPAYISTGFARAIALLGTAMGVIFAVVASIGTVSWFVNGEPNPLPFLPAAATPIWVVALLSQRSSGLYVSEQAVRVVNLTTTRTIPWSQVSDIVTEPAMVRSRRVAEDAVVLRLTDGTRVNTQVRSAVAFDALREMHASLG